MNFGKAIFSPLLDLLSPYEFRQGVKRYQGRYKIKSFSYWDQILWIALARLTYRESFCDIQACLRGNQPKLYPLGFRGKVSRTTLDRATRSSIDAKIASFLNEILNRPQKA